MEVTLKDCNLSTEYRGFDDFYRVIMTLPGLMDLNGINDNIDNYQTGHQIFKNKCGTVYVGCNFVVKYSPADKNLSEVVNEFNFECVNGWSEFRGRDFMIERNTEENSKLLESDSKLQIINKIGMHKNLRPYLDSFFDWLNLSIDIYDGKFFKFD